MNKLDNNYLIQSVSNWVKTLENLKQNMEENLKKWLQIIIINSKVKINN